MATKPYLLCDNRFDDGIPTATDTETGYDVRNIKDWRTYTFWKADNFGTRYITVNCGGPKAADSLAIIGHNLYTANATVSVECSSDNFASDTTVALAGFTPSNDKAIFKTFPSVTKQYWRIKIVTAAVQAFMAIADIGERLTFERFLQSGFDPQQEKIHAEANRSITGNLLGSVIDFIEITVKADWSNLTDSWVRNTFKPVWDGHISQIKPFFFVWNYGNYPADVVLVAVPDDFGLSMPYDPVRRSLSLELEGIKET